jgi:hypothetical protein
LPVRRFSRVQAAALVALLALALAACGEDQSQTAFDGNADAGDPETVVQRYYAALARGEGPTACGLMTPAAALGMKQLPEGERAGSCEQAVTVLARDAIPIRRPQLRNLQISGRSATVTVTSKNPRYASDVVLRRDAHGWKLAYPPGFVSRFDTPPGIRPHDDERENEG